MNDEIKEILVLQNYVNRYKSDEKAIINHSLLTTPLMLDYLEVKNLLDYITNLQQENEFLKLSNPEMNIEHFRVINENKRKIDNLRKQNKELQQENERLKEENKHIFANVNDDELLISNAMNYAEAQDYKFRCEKAIEYIKKHPTKTWYYLKKNHNKKINPNTDLILCQVELLNILQNGSEKDDR